MGKHEPSEPSHGWGPFTGRQLTTIVCVAIVSIVAIPSAAFAAIGVFTSTTVAPAVAGTNSSSAAEAKGVLGNATNAGSAKHYGVVGIAAGPNGVGVQGNGTQFGVFSNGPLGVASGKKLVCAACVTAGDVANRIVLNYNLAPGANSAVVTLPANVPVQVMGVQTVFNFRGVASATVLRIAGTLLEWTGLESTSGSVITQGFNNVAGTHILYLDFAHKVDIQVNNADSIRVHNADSAQRTGTVTITW